MNDLIVIRGTLNAPLEIDPFDLGKAPFNAAILHLEIKPAPVLHHARIIVNSLRVRNQPKLTGSIVQTLYSEDRPEVLAEYAHDGELWYRIGFNQFAAAFIGDVQYMELVD